MKTSKKHNRTTVVSYNPVFPDTNILFAYVIGWKKPEKAVCLAFKKAKTEDVVVVTNQVLEELYRTGPKKGKMTVDQITEALRELRPELVFVKNPTPAELESVFVQDKGDLPILYSAYCAGATVILTRDNKWFEDGVFGVDAEIMEPYGYLYYQDILDGKKTFSNSNYERIVRIFRKDPRHKK